MEVQVIIDWIAESPFHLDLVFTEGFRELLYPSILCVKNTENIQSQLSQNVKMISGLITIQNESLDHYLGIPVVDFKKNFEVFTKIFNLI